MKFALALTLFVSLNISAAIDPVDLLKKVDEVRNPSGSFSMTVDIESSDVKEPSSFEVSLKGNDKTLIKTLSPIRDRGRNLLMLEENMWVYLPNLNRAVRVSLSQKLTGQAANGDIARTRWKDDYTPTIEKEGKDEVILFLTANKKGLTYDKLRVWVKKSSSEPVRAELLSVSGKVLKTAKYEDYKQMAGRVRPTRIVIEDALKATSKSTMFIRSMTEKPFSDSLFNQKNLK